MAILLNAKDISVEFPAKKVLDNVTLGIHEGDRIGIVGKNGDGKSTLLSVLSGAYPPDFGDITHRGSPTVAILGQSDNLDDKASVEKAVVGDAPEYTWASDRRIREIIDALIGDISWDERIEKLSGGQRRRVDLARLLIGSWDILMLDEPTNHLDMSTIAWLAKHLKKRWQKNDGALLVITHDRWFLDEVATSMWEVHDGKVDPFEGGYSAYILQRVERERIEKVSEQKRRNMARKELAWLSRGAQARSSKPKFHIKIARELIADEPPARNSIELKHAAMTRLGKQVFELSKVTEQFGDKTVLSDINWLIGPGDRYGILGENGAGKSTLLKLIIGSLKPSFGTIKVGQTVKAAMLSQRLDELEDLANERVREILGRHKTRLSIDGKSVTSAQLLERLGFAKEHLQSFVRDLSGGQKRRLQLLLTLIDEPNVLILDEPGNDMDTDMLVVMEDLLDSWPGTLLLVSHDRYLMERVTDDQYALINGSLRHVPGGVDEYLGLLDKKQANTISRISNEAVQGTQKDPVCKNKKELEPLSGGESYQAKKQQASIERKLSTLEKQAEDTRSKMTEVDPSDYIELGNIQKDLQEIKQQISELEDMWIKLSEKLGS